MRKKTPVIIALFIAMLFILSNGLNVTADSLAIRVVDMESKVFPAYPGVYVDAYYVIPPMPGPVWTLKIDPGDSVSIYSMCYWDDGYNPAFISPDWVTGIHTYTIVWYYPENNDNGDGYKYEETHAGESGSGILTADPVNNCVPSTTIYVYWEVSVFNTVTQTGEEERIDGEIILV